MVEAPGQAPLTTGTKNSPLRLAPERADRLREALARSVDERRRDPEFRRLLDDHRTRHAEVLQLLADDE